MKKMKEKFVKILSLILVFSVILGAIPAVPTQAASVSENTIEEAEMFANENEEITEKKEEQNLQESNQWEKDDLSDFQVQQEDYPLEEIEPESSFYQDITGEEIESESNLFQEVKTEEIEAKDEGTAEGNSENQEAQAGKTEDSIDVYDNNIEQVPSLSENHTILQKEEKQENSILSEEMVDITFETTDDSVSDFLQIILLDEYGNETAPQTGKVSVKAKQKFCFKLMVEEGYKVTQVETGGGLLIPEDMIYSFVPATDATIKVNITALKRFNVTFSYDQEQVKNLKVYMGKKDVVLQDKVAVEMLEDSIVSFNVELENMMKVVKVTVGEKVIQPVNGTTYVLDSLKEAIEVKIETSLDPSKCNTLSIKVNGHSGSVSIKNNGKIFRSGDTIMTTNSAEEIGVYLDNNYVVNEVLINGKKVEFTGTNTEYTINFSSKERAQTIEIKTTPKISAEEKKVVFANKSEHLSYEVNTYAPGSNKVVIAQKENVKNNTYIIKPQQTTLEFTIIPQNGYEPKVDIPQGVLYDVTKTDNKYVYSLVISTLGNREKPTEIIIDESPQTRNITVRYEKGKVEEIFAMIDGKIFSGVENYDNKLKKDTLEFSYSYNKEIVLQVKTKEGYLLTEIWEGTSADRVKKVSPYRNDYLYSVKIDKNKYVELKIEGEYYAKIFSNPQENAEYLLEKENGMFLAEGGKDYRAYLYLGEKIQTVHKAVLKEGTKVVDAAVFIKDKEKVNFKIPTSVIGKTLTLELSVENQGGASTTFVKIKVQPEMKISSIEGVKSGKLTQEIDTLKEYKLTSNLPAKNLKAEVVTAKPEEEIISEDMRNDLNQKAQAAFEVQVKDNILSIKVKATKAGEHAYIKLYDPGKSKSEKNYYITGGTFLITAQTPAFVSKKPAIKQENGTNLDLVINLTMKSPGKIEDGALWYKIKVTPKYDNKTDQSVKDVTSEITVYRPYYQETQIESVRVIGRENDHIQEGDIPFKADFDVTVSLVQTKDKEEPKESGEFKNIIFSSGSVVKKVMSTKSPVYETNLGIKVKNATVYSGQKNIVVALPVFSKSTSYQKLQCFSNQEGIEIGTDDKNQIIASIDPTVKPGKYSVRVVAQAADNTLPSEKEFTIQVVQGIYALEVESSESIFKEYKKNASLKVNVIYNNGSKEEPKTKKVEWILQDREENDIVKGHEKYEVFSIDDGVITIDKNYIVSSDESKNKFRVKVVAKDFERKDREVVGYSEWITVVNRTVSLGEMIFVKEKAAQDFYEVVARSNQQVTADKINQSKLVILKKGVPEREEYTEEDFIAKEVLDTLIYSSSNDKAVHISDNRIVKVKDTASKLTITAKAGDGSNRSVTLDNLSVTLARPVDLGIMVTNTRNQMIIADTYSGQSSIYYYGLKDDTLKLALKDKGQSGTFFGVEHQLKVTGGKIVNSNPLEGIYEIVGTSERITITLVNKTNKTQEQFLLVNKTLDNSKIKSSKAVSLKVEGVLEAGASTKEQRIYLTIPKEYIGKVTHAWVSLDKMELLNVKKKEHYEALEACIKKGLGEIQTLDDQGRALLLFAPSEESGTYVLPNENYSYKLNVMLGSVTENYEFNAEVRTNAVTLKTTKAKAINAAVKNSYTISAKENGLAVLEMKDKKVQLISAGTLMNRNISGKVNRFAEFFQIKPIINGEVTQYAVALKKGVNPKEIKKNDTSGYLTEYTCTDGKSSSVVKNTLITVNLKDLINKYQISEVSVFTPEEVNTEVSLMSGGKTINAKYVHVPEKESFTAQVTADGKLRIVSKEGVKLKSSNKFTLYAVPEGSFYESVISESSTEGEMMEYGIKLSATVKIKNKATATGKIKFNGADTKVTLGAEQYIADSNSVMGTYRITVPYTKTVDWEVEEIRENKSDSLIKAAKIPGEDKVELTLAKQDLKVAYEKNKKIYGSTLTVPIRAEFGEGTKAETYNLKVVLPKLPMQLEQAVKSLKEVQWKQIPLSYSGIEEESLVENNKALVKEQIDKILAKEGDLIYTISGNAQPPTKTKDGQVVYTILLTDAPSQTQRRITVTLPVERIYTSPGELEAGVYEKLREWELKKITNETRIGSILTSIRSGIKLSEYPHLRLYTKTVEYKAATMMQPGSIKGSFRLISLKEGENTALEIPYELIIPKLLTVEEAVTAVQEKVEALTLNNQDLGEGKTKKQEEIVALANELLQGNEYLVHIQRELQPKQDMGTATIVLRLTYVTSQSNFKDITCELLITN